MAMNEGWNAIDLSYSTLTRRWLDALPQAALVVQNLWDGAEQPSPRVINLRLAHEADRQVAGYAVVNPGVAENIAQARAGLPDDLWEALRFVAIDCELYPDLTPAKVRQESDRIGKPVRVLYTRRDYWQATLGDDVSFGDHWLWDARPGDPVPPFQPYGAWTDASRVIAVQTSGTSVVGAIEVDPNQFDLMKLGGGTMDTIQTLAARQDLAGAALRNDMEELVRLLVYFGVLPAGTVASKAALSG